MKQVALFYTDRQSDWLRHLPALAKYDVAVIPLELSVVAEDRQGAPYARGDAPADYLTRNGCHPLLYVNFGWVMDANKFGAYAQEYRRAQAETVAAAGAWVRDKDDQRVLVNANRQQYAADITNDRYREWMLTQIPDGYDLFVDCSHFWTQKYFKGAGPSNEDRAQAMRELYQGWRDQGRRVVANAGWEMSGDPRALQERVYPFANSLDGVAIEVPTGVSAPSGWWDVVTNKTFPPDLFKLEILIRDWREMDKQIILVTPYLAGSGVTWDQHYMFWHVTAQAAGVDLAVYRSTTAIEPLDADTAPPPPAQLTNKQRFERIEAWIHEHDPTF